MSKPGGTMTNLVCSIKQIGYNFKPWQAVNIAKNVGNVAKFAGPAIGVIGIRLNEGDYLTNVYLLDAGDNMEVDYKGKTVELRKLKTAKRSQKGTKVRIK